MYQFWEYKSTLIPESDNVNAVFFSWSSYFYSVFFLDISTTSLSYLWNFSTFQQDFNVLLSSSHSRFLPRLNAYNFAFISSLLYYDSFLHDCPKHTPSGPDTFSCSVALVDDFLSSFNVVNHMHTCTNLSTTTVPDHYTSLLPTSVHYKRILLEVRYFVLTIADYNEFIPLPHPLIFVSLRPGELLIAIDTGASCLITPLRSDFIKALATPDIPSLGSLTFTDTAILG